MPRYTLFLGASSFQSIKEPSFFNLQLQRFLKMFANLGRFATYAIKPLFFRKSPKLLETQNVIYFPVEIFCIVTSFCLLQGQAVVQLAKTVPDVTIFGLCSKGKHDVLKEATSPIDHLLERGSDYVSEVRKVSPQVNHPQNKPNHAIFFRFPLTGSTLSWTVCAGKNAIKATTYLSPWADTFSMEPQTLWPAKPKASSAPLVV